MAHISQTTADQVNDGSIGRISAIEPQFLALPGGCCDGEPVIC
jgi:hypothetical protein